MEYFHRMGKKKNVFIFFVKNKIIVNEFYYINIKKLLILEFNNKFFKWIEGIDKISS